MRQVKLLTHEWGEECRTGVSLDQRLEDHYLGGWRVVSSHVLIPYGINPRERFVLERDVP